MVESGINLGFVRHGRTQWNIDSRVQGGVDNFIHPDSYDQVSVLAEKLRESGVRFDTIYTSGLQRTIQTAAILSEALEIDEKRVFIEPGFNERGAGEKEGMTFDEADVFEIEFGDSREDYDSFSARVLTAFDSILDQEFVKRGNGVLFVTHSAVMRVIFNKFNLPRQERSMPHDSAFLISPNGEFSIVQ